MISLERLTTAPILSIVGAITATIGSATGLATGLGLEPFWADVGVAVLLLILASYWVILAAKALKPSAPIGFATSNSEPESFASFSKKMLPSAIVATILLVAALWFLYEPAKLLSQPSWKMCGSIVGGCSPGFCVTSLDSRSRPLDAECVTPRDVSGYIEITPRDRTVYRPKLLQIQCQGKIPNTTSAPDSFFVARCDGRLVLQ